MKQDKNNIISKLLQIIKENYDIDYSSRWEEIKDLHLLGYEIGMAPRHLIYLLFDIEEVFGINISKEQIINGNFCTLANIAEIIGFELESQKTLHDAAAY